MSTSPRCILIFYHAAIFPIVLDLSTKFLPFISRARSTFEPSWLGDAAGWLEIGIKETIDVSESFSDLPARLERERLKKRHDAKYAKDTITLVNI